jgi:hypothetical protein
MKAQKHYDRFSTAPVLNARGLPIVALMVDRQPQILKALSDHNQLTADDILVIVGGNKRSLYDTLRVLKAKPNELIRIVPEQVRAGNLRAQLCYQLAPNGVRWLKERGHNAGPPRRSYSLSHDAFASHAMASITAGAALQEHARFVNSEEIQRHPTYPAATKTSLGKWTIPHPRKRRIQADSPLFAIELRADGRKLYRFFLIEADNGTSDKGETIWPGDPDCYDGSSLYEKLEAYVPFTEEKGFSEKWGIPNLYVLFVFRDAGRMKRTIEKFGSFGGSRFILFQLADAGAAPGYLFTRAWTRVGYDSFFLNQHRSDECGAS